MYGKDIDVEIGITKTFFWAIMHIRTKMKSVSAKGGKMTARQNNQSERRTGEERRRFSRSRSIYTWNFDPSGKWWKERRTGGDRRRQGQTAS